MVLGEVTSKVDEKKPSCLLRHRLWPSCRSADEDEDNRRDKSPSFAVGVDSPESVASGEAPREGMLDLRRVLRVGKDPVVRLIQVPPKRRTMTVRGSRNAPTPMMVTSSGWKINALYRGRRE